MYFSKSFGYAIRGILYIAIKQEKKRIQLAEISFQLKIPQHFLGKVLKKLVDFNVINSTKGPYGGFSLMPDTLNTPLIRILELTDGKEQFESCVLCFKKCNAHNPCPLHNSLMTTRSGMIKTLNEMRIGDLIKEQKTGFIRSITSG